jgi:capsular exopolysaccharide synthesis family protein
MVPGAPPDDHQEEYLRMKHTLESILPDVSPRIILFSSATRGEGTTSVITGFAMVLARMSCSTILLDANVRRPGLHTLFRVPRDSGLSDLLLGVCGVHDVMKPTKMSTLSIVTSGSACRDPDSLLDAKGLHTVLNELQPFTDWILIDSAPVTEFSDALALANVAHGCVLVIEAEKTRREVQRCARDLLRGVNAPLVGAVLNRRMMYIPSWLYSRL